MKDFLPNSRDHYRFGVTAEEAKNLSPKVKKLLSFHNAGIPERHKFRVRKIIKEWSEHPEDTGGLAITLAITSEKIKKALEHLKKHPQDKHSAYGINNMIQRRRRFMMYFRKRQPETYYKVLREFDVADIHAIAKPNLKNHKTTGVSYH